MRIVAVFLAMLVASPVMGQSPEQRLKDGYLISQAVATIHEMSREQLNALREVLVICPKQYLGDSLVRDCAVADERYRIEFHEGTALDSLLGALSVSWSLLLAMGKEIDQTKDQAKRGPLVKDYFAKIEQTKKVVDQLAEAVTIRYRVLRTR